MVVFNYESVIIEYTVALDRRLSFEPRPYP